VYFLFTSFLPRRFFPVTFTPYHRARWNCARGIKTSPGAAPICWQSKRNELGENSAQASSPALLLQPTLMVRMGDAGLEWKSNTGVGWYVASPPQVRARRIQKCNLGITIA
jgi:hypothetical protein